MWLINNKGIISGFECVSKWEIYTQTLTFEWVKWWLSNGFWGYPIFGQTHIYDLAIWQPNKIDCRDVFSASHRWCSLHDFWVFNSLHIETIPIGVATIIKTGCLNQATHESLDTKMGTRQSVIYARHDDCYFTLTSICMLIGNHTQNQWVDLILWV